MTLPDASMWKEARATKMTSLVEKGVLKLEGRDIDICGTSEVLKLESNPDGTCDKRRSRLCVQGCQQTPGVSFEET